MSTPIGKLTPVAARAEELKPVGKLSLRKKEEPAVVEKRGIRNNNPGNIRKSADVWEGTAKEQKDEEFVSFESPEMGVRAMAKILKTYREEHNATTVEEIISRWAPTEENDTESYIESVVQQTKIPRDSPVSEKKLPSFIKAIIKHENGEVPYGDDVIKEGIAKANPSEYSDMDDGWYKDPDTGEKFEVKNGKRR